MATSSSGQRRFVGPDDGNEELHLSGSSYEPNAETKFLRLEIFSINYIVYPSNCSLLC